jgi:hypothetical protein
MFPFLFDSGEAAFKTMNTSFGWARRPMMHRITDIKQEVPVTFIYGSRSWVDSNTGYHAKYLRHESYVDVQVKYTYIDYFVANV